MRYHLHPIHITLDAVTIERARKFATAVAHTTNYRDSNQFNIKKIETDHFISKLGEEAVCRLYRQFGKEVSAPDYEIYQGRNKSWEEDLNVENMPLAVKTQPKSSAIRYGLSWTFQWSPVRKDPILQHPKSWVCLVGCNDIDSNYNCYVYPPYQIDELTFREPRLPQLRGKKKVVYAVDLPTFI